MIISSLQVDKIAFEEGTGWEIKPQGACREDVCIPLHGAGQGEVFDVRPVASTLGMALVEDSDRGLWALGPHTGGKALASATMPAVTLPEWRGGSFSIGSLRGTKVFLLAWASW